MTKTILSQITAEWRLFSLHFSFDGTEVAKSSDYDHSHFLKNKDLVFRQFHFAPQTLSVCRPKTRQKKNNQANAFKNLPNSIWQQLL